jgi:branched-chain amino acid transport system substrate-binding protein
VRAGSRVEGVFQPPAARRQSIFAANDAVTMTPMTIVRRVLGIAGFAALLAPPLSAAAADVLEIPVIVSLTGPSAFLGKAIQQGLGGVEEVTNRSGGIAGRRVKFVYHDDQTNPQVAVQLMNAVIAQNPPLVLGSENAAVCQAMAAIAKDGPVIYCFSPGVHPDGGSSMFSAGVSVHDVVTVALRYFAAQGVRRIATIMAVDASGQDADRAVDDALAAMHGEVAIVDREHFAASDIAVSAQMAKIKAANPQLLIAWTTGTPVTTVFRAFQESGMTIPVLTSAGNSVISIMRQWAPFLPHDLYCELEASSVPPQIVTDAPTKAAVAGYVAQMERMSVVPDVMNSLAWDPGMLAVEAFRSLGPDATAVQIRQYLTGLRSWAGISGRYDFRSVPQRGIGANTVYVSKWDATGQTWVTVSRAGGAKL